jgi:FixJ family two-component response regulator/GGDEF domain-containing protein
MSKARILAIDDQRYFRELVERLLRDEGYTVRTASSGEEALRILEREDFEVVVTDLVMPGIDGCELVRKVKERLVDQEIIVVSGVVDVATAVQAMKLGASDYLVKPFDETVLSDSIERILDRRRLRQEHARLVEENLEFMGVLSLVERGTGLFSSLAAEPLAERLVEGLCIETSCQSAVVWIAKDIAAETFELAGARGLIHVEEEAQSITWPEILISVGPALARDRSVLLGGHGFGEEGESLHLPLRFGGDLVGVVRLADKLDGKSFSQSDRRRAEKFCDFGATALRNALRFRALERRSLRDPETHAYAYDYFEDAVRNEIQKANRFGHRFSVLRVQLEAAPNVRANDACSLEYLNQGLERRARVVESALRATDLLASSGPHDYSILLPMTDAIGAGILGQRIRSAIANLGDSDIVSRARVSAASFPVDGTQLDSLCHVVEERLDQTRESLLSKLPELSGPQPLNEIFDRMLELGSVEHVDVEGQILRFVLEDVARRPADRGVLFISPGARWLPDVLEILKDLSGHLGQTQVVLVAEAEDQDPIPGLTWATKSSLDVARPFLVYFGDGPAYALVGQVTLAAERTPLFQTNDRALVEHLAFELQRELGILTSV